MIGRNDVSKLSTLNPRVLGHTHTRSRSPFSINEIITIITTEIRSDETRFANEYRYIAHRRTETTRRIVSKTFWIWFFWHISIKTFGREERYRNVRNNCFIKYTLYNSYHVPRDRRAPKKRTKQNERWPSHTVKSHRDIWAVVTVTNICRHVRAVWRESVFLHAMAPLSRSASATRVSGTRSKVAALAVYGRIIFMFDFRSFY